MPPVGQFDALEDSSDDDDEPRQQDETNVQVPSHEDLSLARTDEETVLTAVYGEDFSREIGVWGCAKLAVHVRPPDIEREHVGSELTLSAQLAKQYPYVQPKLELCHVTGLSKQEQKDLMCQLEKRAQECASVGSVMMCELVQVVEDFLLAHNRNPNMSEWEQMKAREALQQQQEERTKRDQEKELKRIMMEEHTDEYSHDRINASGGEVEREMARQMEALAEADRKRRKFKTCSSNNESGDEVDDESEDEFDDDNDYPTITAGTSRYRNDFIEMGVLGRGGGGEVVKVRNRLDRRLYAVKKIELESEVGKFASVAAIQNKKLRREVTTISRMLHKNIVRYYQAWVEGGEEVDAPSVEEDEGEEGENVNSAQSNDDDDDDESSGDEANDSGWWTNSPTDGVGEHLLSRGGSSGDFSEHSSESASWVAEDDDTIEMSNQRGVSHSASIQDLLGQEQDFQSPLLAGMGFQNQSYHGLFKKKKKQSTSTSQSDDDLWDESGVKIDPSSNNRILYIQMEYCSTTLRKLIDESVIIPLDENAVWRMLRQILEALVYIHSQKIIHRDLKPSNVFLDAEGNVRLGDFGLATRHRVNTAGDSEIEEESEIGVIYDAIEDISGLLGGSRHTETEKSAGESMTGGVGTTFYRAPEQEQALTRAKGESAYGVQADVFSLGIILFEMFHPPFETYMERAETLSKLRGESVSSELKEEWMKTKVDWSSNDPAWKGQAAERFPASFLESAPENAQRMILWCLERQPSRRPSAEELLSSELLPRKMELEELYLKEALQTLTNPQSDSYQQILESLFARPTPDLMEVTYDTDAACKANNMGNMMQENKRTLTPSEGLMRAIGDIRATGGLNVEALTSLAMSASSLVSATSALRRARNTGKKGKGVMKRSAQRVAGILSMNAASSAAVTGAADGVHGADPRVVEAICDVLRSIFVEHGAVHLKSPLLRPRPSNTHETPVGGPAEVINTRGTILLLPEDLTVSFARSLGRGGAATSNVKRYDFDRVFLKSLAGGHPRESLEASFDIVHDDLQGTGDQLEAEALMVVCQAMSSFASMKTSERHPISSLPESVTTPLWFIRLTHTRLVDSIMDICGVPQKESSRKACLSIFARVTAPAPGTLFKSIRQPQRKRSSSVSQKGSIDDGSETPDAWALIEASVKGKVLPRTAAKRLEAFLTNGCSPLPANIDEALDTILVAIGKVRLLDTKDQGTDPRRLKRYSEIDKSVKNLKQLMLLMTTMGIGPIVGSKNTVADALASRPIYLALDLGLRQKRKHYNGQLFFQAIVLPDNFFEAEPRDHDSNRKPILGLGTGLGTKVAEGGRYDDLVRKYRPPGNFGTALINFYTAAQIPTCVGVRFFIGKFVELAYVDAALAKAEVDNMDQSNPNETNAMAMDSIRHSLGHPLALASTVQCIVTGVHGMDAATATDRLLVASRLWTEGISAEYMPQSGVILSLLKRYRESFEPLGDRATDWSLDELFGVCAILKIPYVVIVQPHLLRDKKSVRLRRIAFDCLSGTSSGSETFVSLDNLANTVLLGTDDDVEQGDSTRTMKQIQTESEASSRVTALSSSSPEVECIYVDNDQYYGIKQVSKETSQWKTILKRIKGVTQRSETYLSTLTESSQASGIPVFAVNISFWELRDFGTYLMKRGESSAMGASQEITEKYPKHKKTFKTLAMAIDNLLKKTSVSKGDLKREVMMLLYSIMDDRFDIVSLDGLGNDANGEGTETSRRKSERR